MEGEDLSGWLIPQKLAQEFERQFLAGAVDDKWSEFITFALWSKVQGAKAAIDIRFENYS